MKKVVLILVACLLSACSLEDFGFEYTTNTGLNITKEKYDAIKKGSSYLDVKSIIGGSCDNYYSSDDEDWYTCVDNYDSSKRIVLKFSSGKLISKSSSGLNE